MPLPPKLLVLSEALETIEHEIETYRHTGIETGGVVIGAPLDEHTVLVLAATGPGPNAEHYGAEYALDVAYAQNQLALYHRRYPTADYVGEWHRHPDSLPVPSGGDWTTAAQILRDPAYKVDALINPIVVLPGGEFQIRFFYLHRMDLPRREPFQQIPFETVSRSDARVVDLLGLEPMPTHSPPVPSSALPSHVLERLASEEHEIRDRYHVTLSEPTAEGYVIEVAVDGQGLDTVRLLCDSSYPYAPPSVRVIRDGKRVAYKSRMLTGWSSQRRLIDVIEDARRRADTSTSHRFPPSGWTGGGSLALLAGGLPSSPHVTVPLALGLLALFIATAAFSFWQVRSRAAPVSVEQQSMATVVPVPTCMELWNAVQQRTSATTATATGIVVQTLDDAGVRTCQDLPGLAADMVGSNLFVISPVAAQIKISSLGQPLIVPAATVTGPSAPLQAGTYTLELEGCSAPSGCSQVSNLPTGGGLLVSVLASA
jgi:integrative and conjugative element protein (TIGR02256 family)